MALIRGDGWKPVQASLGLSILQDKAMYGRVLHLNPVKWENDWPVIGEDKDGDGCGEPVKRYKKTGCRQDLIL